MPHSSLRSPKPTFVITPSLPLLSLTGFHHSNLPTPPLHPSHAPHHPQSRHLQCNIEPNQPPTLTHAFKRPPQIDGSLPFLGNFLWILSNLSNADEFTKAFNQHGNIVHATAFSTPVYHVRDRHTLEEVLSNEDDYSKGSGFLKLGFAFGNGLFMIDSKQEHRQMRSLLNPSFGPEFLKNLVPVFTSVATEGCAVLTSHLEENPGVDVEISSMCKRMALDVIGVGGFDTNFASVHRWQNLFQYRKTNSDDEDMSYLWDQLSRNALFVVANLPVPNHWLPGWKQCVQAVNKVESLVYKIIQQRSMEKDIQGKDILASLLRERKMNNAPWLTDQMIRDECMSFLFAGSDTSAGVLMWLFYELAENKARRERVEREINEMLNGRYPTDLTADDLKHLPYLNACIYETLRLYPPVFALGREARRHTKVMGYDVPPDQIVVVHMSSLFRDANLWKDAEEWIPERWLEESPEVQAKMKSLFLPFGIGPRGCIGSRFALMEIASIAVVVMGRFRLTQASRASEVTYRLTVGSKAGVWVKMKPK